MNTATPGGEKAVAGGVSGFSNASSDAIKQRILGDTTQLQKRARQRAESAKKRAEDEEAYHQNVLAGPSGGLFAEAAAIAHTLQPSSPERSRARGKQLTPGSEQSYHLDATQSYMEEVLESGTGTTITGTAAGVPL